MSLLFWGMPDMEIHIWLGDAEKGVDYIKNPEYMRSVLKKYEICPQGFVQQTQRMLWKPE